MVVVLRWFIQKVLIKIRAQWARGVRRAHKACKVRRAGHVGHVGALGTSFSKLNVESNHQRINPLMYNFTKMVTRK